MQLITNDLANNPPGLPLNVVYDDPLDGGHLSIRIGPPVSLKHNLSTDFLSIANCNYSLFSYSINKSILQFARHVKLRLISPHNYPLINKTSQRRVAGTNNKRGRESKNESLFNPWTDYNGAVTEYCYSVPLLC